MTEWRTICCPVDLTEESHAALREAAELARRAGARLVIIHVVGGAGLSGAEPIFAPPPHGTRSESEGSETLRQWAAEAEQAAGRPIVSIRVQGDAVTEILRLTEEQGCDLIVLGKHPRAALPRLFRRSVAEMVVRRAAVPVLVVPPPPLTSSATP
jgi:nucleotide-binding universal stress UspA family protein